MRHLFDIVMRIVSTLIGVMMVLIGGVWTMQGLSVGPPAILQGPMVADSRWAVYGVIMMLLGVAQIVWTNTRRPNA